MSQTTERSFDWEAHRRKYPYLSQMISDYVHNKDCTCNACQLKVTTDSVLLRKTKGGKVNAN